MAEGNSYINYKVVSKCIFQVLVNGHVAYEKGELTGAKAGTLI